MKKIAYRVLNEIKGNELTFLNNFIQSLDLRQKQVIFVQCIGLFDSCFFQSLREDCTKEESLFYQEIIHYSYSVFFSMFYKGDFNQISEYTLEAIDSERLALCRKILYSCKVVGWINFLLANSKTGSISMYSLFNVVRIKFTRRFHWNEHYETQFTDYYSKVVVAVQKKDYDSISREKEEIIAKMKETVFCWHNHFMGFTNDIDTEMYFQRISQLDSHQETEFDMFPIHAIFGGIEYEHFIQTVIEFAAYSIKHLYFAEILKEKNPNLFYENLFLCLFTEQQLVSLIQENREIPKDAARNILTCLSIENEDSYYGSGERRHAAPLIKISNSLYLRSIVGFLDHPYIFMLDKLRLLYRTDWDRNTSSREEIFREELYRLFDDNYICIPHNIVIREGNRILTDIDALVIDKRSCETAIFQLKWQDHTTNSTFSLASKSQNYTESTTQWLDRITSWVLHRTCSELSMTFGVDQKYIDKSKFFIFVVGRLHGNFSGDSIPYEQCAWAQWYQLLSTFAFIREQTNLISSAYEIIRKSSPYKQRYSEPPAIYTYRKYKLIYGGNLRGILSGKTTRRYI